MGERRVYVDIVALWLRVDWGVVVGCLVRSAAQRQRYSACEWSVGAEVSRGLAELDAGMPSSSRVVTRFTALSRRIRGCVRSPLAVQKRRTCVSVAILVGAVAFGIADSANAETGLIGWRGTVHFLVAGHFDDPALGEMTDETSEVSLSVGGTSDTGDGLVTNSWHFVHSTPCTTPAAPERAVVRQTVDKTTLLSPNALQLYIDSANGTYQVYIAGDAIWDFKDDVNNCGSVTTDTIRSPAFGISAAAPCTLENANKTLPLPQNWDHIHLSGVDTCKLANPYGVRSYSIDWNLTRQAPQLDVQKRSVHGGSGRVASTPAGIDCGAICSHRFDFGSTVTLTATPSPNSFFAGWSSGCVAATTCSVVMDHDHTVTASFDEYPPMASPEMKHELAASANYESTLGGSWALCAVATAPPVDEACAYGSAAAWIASGILNIIATEDPPDPNFRSIALVRPIRVRALTANGALSRRAAAALTDLLVHQAKQVAVERALLASIERAQGAAGAGQATWVAAQERAAARASRQLAQLVVDGPRLWRLAGESLRRVHFTATVVDARRFIASTRRNGLSRSLVRELRRRGCTSRELRTIANEIKLSTAASFARDPATVLIRGSRTSYAKLAANLKSFAKHLDMLATH